MALEAVCEFASSEVQASRFFRTPCFPAGAGPDYVNAAATFTFDGSAETLLRKLHAVEADFGRERQERWGQRSLDLDLIDFGSEVHPDASTYAEWRDLEPEAQKIRAPSELILPHPRIQDRAFVLVPLLDLAPDWVHPVLGFSVRQMTDRLDPAMVKEVIAI